MPEMMFIAKIWFSMYDYYGTIRSLRDCLLYTLLGSLHCSLSYMTRNVNFCFFFKSFLFVKMAFDFKYMKKILEFLYHEIMNNLTKSIYYHPLFNAYFVYRLFTSNVSCAFLMSLM